MDVLQVPTALSLSGHGSSVPPNSPISLWHPPKGKQVVGRIANSQAYRSPRPAEIHDTSSQARAEVGTLVDRAPRTVLTVSQFQGLRPEPKLSTQTAPITAKDEGQERAGESNIQRIRYQLGLAVAEVEAVRTRLKTDYEPTHIQSEANARPNVTDLTNALYRGSGFGHQMSLPQNDALPTQAPRHDLLNGTPDTSSQFAPTQNDVAPTQPPGNAGWIINDHLMNGEPQSSEVQWENIPLTNAGLPARPPDNVAATIDDSVTHLTTPERIVPPAQSPGGSPATVGNSTMLLTPPSSVSPPQSTTPSPNSQGMSGPAPYTQMVMAPRLQPRNRPTGAVSFRGVSQGGLLLWNRVDDHFPLVRVPNTAAEKMIVYQHLWCSAHERAAMAQTGPEKAIWLDALDGLTEAAKAAARQEIQWDESEMILLDG